MDLINKDYSKIQRIDKSKVVLPSSLFRKKYVKRSLTKEDFIKQVSKIEDTFENEFKPDFNSPELLWEHFLKKYFS